ncbi:hypothetical protein ACFV8E_09245 [Streptomyces sp. NPDC059849]|uniref:hypothetical protein n=1 Tax=Streptomyces sp. NPDC059849 TaxID=3346969 RepID=UPI003662ADE1
MNTTFELVPGMLTTREEIAAVFGCGTFQGIEPAVEAKKVLVYSDPSAGAAFGYTFDGRAEDDEYGPLYLYTGYGKSGPQELKSRNKSLRDHAVAGRDVHLFVAHGKVPGSGQTQQRYIGQMIVDPITPYVTRAGIGEDKKKRTVLVFRLRPAPGTTPAWQEQDRLHAAATTAIEEIDVPSQLAIPAQTSVKEKNSEQFIAAQTIANVAGGPKTVNLREGQLVEAFKKHLAAAGHQHKTFQITIAGEPGALTPDLYDVTDHVLYEGKGLTTRHNIRVALGQLMDYRRHVEKFEGDGLRVAVLLPSEPSSDLKDLLTSQGVHLVYRTEDGFAGFPLPS